MFTDGVRVTQGHRLPICYLDIIISFHKHLSSNKYWQDHNIRFVKYQVKTKAWMYTISSWPVDEIISDWL